MKGKNILIIDDDIDFGFLMTEFFSKRGGKVTLAYSITEGLEILQHEKTDYIFLDNNLPDGLGWSKTDHILETYPNAQLILISSLDVPRTTTSSFSIFFKPLINDELHKMFDLKSQ
jgi:DNA-binding response OmpR family regulator